MLLAVLSVLGLIAFGAWLTAVASAVAIVGLAPKGRRLGTYFALGWWRFSQVEQETGPAGQPHIARYRLAFLAFFGSILAMAVAAMLISLVEGT